MDFKNMMGQFQEAQKQAEEMKKRLDTVMLKEEYRGITVQITGNREIKDIQVDESLLEDREELQDMMVLAVNQALLRAEEVNQKEMQSLIPGGLDFLKG